MGEGSAMQTDPHHTPTIIQPLTSQPQKTQKPRRLKRKDTEIPQPSGLTTNVADEAINQKMDDHLVRAATTASSLEAKQDSGNIDKTQSKATPNKPSSPGTSSGGGPRRQETIGDTIAQTRSENVSKLSIDLLLARGNTLRSGEDSLKLQELMELCITLQTRVLDLKTIKTTQGNKIDSLKRRVKNLERRNRSRTHKLKRLYKVGLTATVESSGYEEDLGEDASKQGRRIHDIDVDEDITLVNDDNEMFDVEEPSVSVSAFSALTKDSAATTTTATIPTPRKGIVFQDPGTTTTTTISSLAKASHANVQDKGKGKMVEPEKPINKKELIRLDEDIALKLQAEFDEEVRLARERVEKEQEANVALTKEWDDIQAKIKADHELAQRMQAQEEVTKKQKVDDVQEIAEVDDDQEASKIKEEVAIDAFPLATKPPSIVDWKIHKEGKKTYYQIIRADGSSKMYLVFSYMLKSFDREDLETLWKLVKAKHGSTRPEEGYERVLWGDIKTMFDPHVEYTIWRNQ
ncbi:hypothetical protein Tco_1355543 [Tanacetum coccineum]